MNAQAEWRISPQAMVTLTLRGDHNSNPICQVNCFANFVAPFNSLLHDPNVPYNQVIRSLHRLFLAPPASSGSCASASHGPPSTRATRCYGTASGSSAITYPGTIAAVVATNTPMKNNFIISNGPIAPGGTRQSLHRRRRGQPIPAHQVCERWNGGFDHRQPPVLPASQLHHHE